MKDPQPRDTGLREAVHMLRYWLARNNIPDADKVHVEVHFPNHSAQAAAIYTFWREMNALTQFTKAPPDTMSPYGSTTFELEGVKVTFTNPDRLDTRRGVIWRDES